MIDLSIVAIITIFIVSGARRGAVRTLVVFLGSLGVSILSIWAGRGLAPMVYENCFKESITKNINDSVAQNISQGTTQTVNAVLDDLPDYVTTALNAFGISTNQIGLAVDSGATSTGTIVADTASATVESFISPIIISLIGLILSGLIFIVLMIFVRMLAGFINSCCNVPVLKQANHMGGGLIGFLQGTLIIILLIIVSSILLPMIISDYQTFKTEVIDKTILFNWIYNLNVFNIPSLKLAN